MPRKAHLSRRLREARLACGLSAAAVAARVGVSTPAVYQWEAGRNRPRADNLRALCKLLKLPLRATRDLAAG